MAGHSKFKNIMHRKGAQDSKRAKTFTKLIREIMTAARTGQADPIFNPRLRLAINNARSLNLPKDRIDNAIKKGSSPMDGENYEEIRYEGYLPGGIAIIVEALTDNRNRTASDVRSSFTKMGGNLGESNSVSFMFDRIGIIEYSKTMASDESMLDSAIEFGADDCHSNEETHTIICNIENFNEICDKLNDKYGASIESKIIWQAHNQIEITDQEQINKLFKFIDLLDESDDVQNIYGNYSIIEKE